MLYIGILLISLATIAFELTLTRLFAVAEWYHFAFLSISVALLGYAGSGTLLALLPHKKRSAVAIGAMFVFAPSIAIAYGTLNALPLDTYQLAYAPSQLFYLLVVYFSLTIPFTCSGYLTAYWLDAFPTQSNRIYGLNLLGSALGAASLSILLPFFEGEGTVWVAAAIGCLGCWSLGQAMKRAKLSHFLLPIATFFAIVGALRPPWTSLRLSPYKALSYALLRQDAQHTVKDWNLFSRVDVIESQQIHVAPGLSLNYRGTLPPQYGLTIDGDDLSPLTRRLTPTDRAFLNFLPSTIAYRLRPQAKALIVYPRGGLDVSVALESGAKDVTIVEDNPLIVLIVRDLYGPFQGNLYRDPRVHITEEGFRSALPRFSEQFDIIQICLSESFHPLSLASYSLAENHVYTVEAFTQALSRLHPFGFLVVTRWLQDPPSESLRAAATAIQALEQLGLDPKQRILAFRTWSTMTLLVSREEIGKNEIAMLTDLCKELGYDLVYYPGISGKLANRYNVLSTPVYYEAFQSLLERAGREELYRRHPYDIRPATDDHPFFGHYFRWPQVPAILQQIGKSWQPFGGSGFLLVLFYLIVALATACMLAIIPLWQKGFTGRELGKLGIYFASIGMGYLMIEMPLLQAFILYLGQPTLTFIVVLSTLLLFSGIGSLLSPHIDGRLALGVLLGLLIVYPTGLHWLSKHTLSLPIAGRIALTVTAMLPLGLFMGMPFANGLRQAEKRAHGSTAWIWGINGGASVVSSILAMIIALEAGYSTVLASAACFYALALLTYLSLRPLR